jgi:hypothetical protein
MMRDITVFQIKTFKLKPRQRKNSMRQVGKKYLTLATIKVVYNTHLIHFQKICD